MNAGLAVSKRRGMRSRIYVVELRGNFTVVPDPTETIAQLNAFATIPRVPGRSVRVVVDLAGLDKIDAGGLLLLCSRIMLLGEQSWVIRIEVTAPSNPDVQKLLVDSGFTYFLASRVRTQLADGSPTLKLFDGFVSKDQSARTSFAAQLREFLHQKNPDLVRDDREMIYLAVMECLENVSSHAYDKGGTRHFGITPPRMWAAVGLHDEGAKVSSVAIVDLGAGIVRSVQRKPRASVFRNYLDRYFVSPEKIVAEAVRGIRTETGERKHGKGLSTLRHFATSSSSSTLYVISDGGMVTCSNLGTRRMPLPRFHGTLVCLDIATMARQEAS